MLSDLTSALVDFEVNKYEIVFIYNVFNIEE